MAETPDRRRWALDFALVGGLTSILAPLCAGMTVPGYLAVTGLTGALTGVVVGTALAGGQPRLRRVPVPFLLLLAIVVGGLWGGTVGFVGGLAFASARHGEILGFLSLVCGAVAGAVQLGWFYLPYAILSARRRTTTPLVGFAIGLGSVLGIGVLYALAVHPRHF